MDCPTVSDSFRPVSDLFGLSTTFRLNVGPADIAAFLLFQTVSGLFQTCLDCPLLSVSMYRTSRYSCFPTVSDSFRPVSDLFGLSTTFCLNRYSCFPIVSDSFRPVSDLFGLSTAFRLNVGPADIAAFLLFQTGSDLFQTSLDCPTVSDSFRPVSDLFGLSTTFRLNVGPADIAAFLLFQICFRPLWTVHYFPYKCRTSRYSCFPIVSDSSDLFSNLFGLPTTFRLNVGPADIAAFLLFQTASDLFQTSFDCPIVSDSFRPGSDLFGLSTTFRLNVGPADIAALLSQTVSDLFQTSLDCPLLSV